MEDFIYRNVEHQLEPFLYLKDIFAIPFNHWKKDNEWLVMIIINGKPLHVWVEANSPHDAVVVAFESVKDYLLD